MDLLLNTMVTLAAGKGEANQYCCSSCADTKKLAAIKQR